jgi:hypothetical protein
MSNEEEDIWKLAEKYGMRCPYEGSACDCCNNWGCTSNINPDKEDAMYA